MREEIKNAIKRVTGKDEVHLETPEREEHGDYSSNIAMTMFSNFQFPISNFQFEPESPRQLAEEIKDRLIKDDDLAEVVEKVEVAGPGFINFWLTGVTLVNELQKAVQEGEDYGKIDIGQDKTVIVEYSSPNIAKPFTVGHLRSTVIGDAVANIMEFAGYKVLRDNHLGDWGTQFGKQIYAIKEWGDEEKIENAENPVKELVTLYVKFHKEVEKDPSIEEKGREWFKKLEEGDKEARRIWKKCVEWSWQEFEKIYKILGVEFSDEFNDGRGLGESFFEEKIDDVVEELKEKGLLKEGEEGAQLVFFEDEKYPPAMILKKDGTTLYHTRDLATDKYRKENYDPDLIINEVGAEQTLYFKQLFEIEEMLGWFKDGQRIHVPHGLIRFKDKKMSTRKGDVIWLEDILNEVKKRAYRLTAKSGIARAGWGDPDELIPRKTKIDKDLASGKRDKDVEAIAIGSLKYNDLKRDPKTDIVFDWDEVLNMDGNSGPYLQYTYARCKSVLRKSEFPISDFQFPNDWRLENGDWKMEQEELALLRQFPQFSGVIEDVIKNYSPNLLCNYLYDLAQKYNTFYNAHRIIDVENSEQGTVNSKEQDTEHGTRDTQALRLALTAATAQIIKNGLYLLGIDVPERM